MQLNLNCESLQNQIEVFVPQLQHLTVEDIILSPTTTQNCLEMTYQACSEVTQLVINIFKSGLSHVSFMGALKIYKFVQIRKPLLFDACQTVKDFWSNPYNRSTLEKINALTNALYIGMQTTEGVIRTGIVKFSTEGREKTVLITCALSVASFTGNMVLKKIRNQENLSTALIEISKKPLESMHVILFLEEEYFKTYPSILALNNIFTAVENVYATAKYVIQANNSQQIKLLNWAFGYLNCITLLGRSVLYQAAAQAETALRGRTTAVLEIL